jgi:ERCC4-related helicase
VERETGFAPGARVLARDEEWLVRGVTPVQPRGYLVRAIGVSEFVQDQPVSLLTDLEPVELLRPEDTRLVSDATPRFRRSRLYLEAVLRRTPLRRTEHGLALADRFLLDSMPYQQRPAELALSNPRPRILIADVVGLGKTLEIGLLLAELIRRGRGERILVATPQHVLEQFQHELWTRFSIPLVRLDSKGIERIQREIPAGRNPFTYFKRIIVSIDTLKNRTLYKHHLETTQWDAVVIDESHNLIGETTQRNKLARLLAQQTEALILASATPHNGDKRSFAELIHLLDPAAIVNPNDYDADDIAHLYIRRTKINQEVRDRTAERWADRGESTPVRCAATEPEERIFAELTGTWLTRPAWLTGAERSSKRQLFPYTLLKAFLSSHRALAETVGNRLDADSCTDPHEREALTRLRELTDAMSDDDSAKLTRLLDQLDDIGVAAGSSTRVVVFSERITTLQWLAKVVPARLELPDGAVRVMHGGLPDTEQQKIVNEFALASSLVRVLLTGDIASEGVNLHRQCHHLIHYDLPWSLIRIEQRNGRIDRYGQLHAPEFRALILTSAAPDTKDDTTVAEKLLARETEAHHSLGSADAVTGEYLADREERRLVQDLLAGRPVEHALQPPAEHDVLADLLAEVGNQSVAGEPAKATVPSLFASTEKFVDEALQEVYGSVEDELGLRREDRLLALDAPADLEQRLADLPGPYLSAQRENGQLRLKLTFDKAVAQQALNDARERGKTAWPDITYASEIHPLVDWLVDKVLVRLGRQEAPVLTAEVEEPIFLVQGVYCNRLGQPTVVQYMAVSGLPKQPTIRMMDEVLAEAGVRPDMPNPLHPVDVNLLTTLVPAAIQAARGHLDSCRRDADRTMAETLRTFRNRVNEWEQLSLKVAVSARTQPDQVKNTADEQRDLIDQLETVGDPLIRLLAVLEAVR